MKISSRFKDDIQQRLSLGVQENWNAIRQSFERDTSFAKYEQCDFRSFEPAITTTSVSTR